MLAESKRVGLNAGVGERDLEGAVGDGTLLTDELVQPLFGDRAVASGIDVGPWASPGGLPVERTRNPMDVPGCWPHDDVRSRA